MIKAKRFKWGVAMDEKKRARIMRVCRVLALILAVLLILGIFVQGYLY